MSLVAQARFLVSHRLEIGTSRQDLLAEQRVLRAASAAQSLRWLFHDCMVKELEGQLRSLRPSQHSPPLVVQAVGLIAHRLAIGATRQEDLLDEQRFLRAGNPSQSLKWLFHDSIAKELEAQLRAFTRSV